VRGWRLSAAAEQDIIIVLAYTAREFGELARARYEALLAVALRDIADDPGRAGSIPRPELGDGIRSYHLRNSRRRVRGGLGLVRRPRHLILYRPINPSLVGIGRVLHDGMDLERHLPENFGEHL